MWCWAMGKFGNNVNNLTQRQMLISVDATATYPKQLKKMPKSEVFRFCNKTTVPMMDCPYIAAAIR